MSQDSELADEILRALRQILRQVAEHSKSMARDVGLTLPQLLCIRTIGRSDRELTLAEVADEIQLSPATTSRIVDRLERAKLVNRFRGTNDRRTVRLSLTESGQKRFAELPAPLQEVFLRKLSSLPEKRRKELLLAVNELSSMMEADGFDAAPMLHAGELPSSE